MYIVCCKILGVKPGSDEETIKMAYRKSAMELHPDRNDSEKAHEYFTILNNAYQYLLSNPYSESMANELVRERVQHQKASQRREKFKKKYNFSDGYTMRELLKKSLIVRIFYICFHIIFIFIGLWLVIHAVYDLFFHKLVEYANPLSAYFSLFFGFLLGAALTVVFLITGISFIRKQY